MNRTARISVALALLFLIGFSLGFGLRTGHAEYDNIRQQFYRAFADSGTVAASGTYTTEAFRGLDKTNVQSARFRNTGTSPNYKVEVLVDIDGMNGTSGTFTKPETGGDLGTFTDQNWHVVSINTPVCTSNKLKFTELGGANSMVINSGERTQ